MIEFVEVMSRFMALVRSTVLFAAVVFAIICIVDWAVRTRRINPFNPLARFFRETIDPFIAPIERRVVRAGQLPSSAPLWALGAVVIGGILLIGLLDFIIGQAMGIAMVFQGGSGARNLFPILVNLTFAILRVALFITVILSWIRTNPYSPWVRWAYAITEPILRPLRMIIPPLGGMIDITPIIAYFLLGVVQGIILGMV